MPSLEDFRIELYRMMYEAVQQGNGTVDVSSDGLHTRVGNYPGPKHRMPMCCLVMRDAVVPDYGDIVLGEPSRGQGDNLIIRYVVPKFEPLRSFMMFPRSSGEH